MGSHHREALVGLDRPVVGWCVGVIRERNMEPRSFRKIDGELVNVNFLIYYEIDDNLVPTVLHLEEYGGQEESSWVMLLAGGRGWGAGAVGWSCRGEWSLRPPPLAVAISSTAAGATGDISHTGLRTVARLRVEV
jgi:hypothetical protein